MRTTKAGRFSHRVLERTIAFAGVPLLVATLMAGCKCGPEPTRDSGINNMSKCDPSLWDHTYMSWRLKVIEECKTVRGIVEGVSLQEDGDYHINLKLDPEFSNLVNSANIEKQNGALVVEVICAGPSKGIEGVLSSCACKNYQNKIQLPQVGTHVEVTGSYVKDRLHGWMEIHPITSITVK